MRGWFERAAAEHELEREWRGADVRELERDGAAYAQTLADGRELRFPPGAVVHATLRDARVAGMHGVVVGPAGTVYLPAQDFLLPLVADAGVAEFGVAELEPLDEALTAVVRAPELSRLGRSLRDRGDI